MEDEKFMLDACCGSKMLWFDKEQPNTIYADKRYENHILCDGRTLEVAPDIQIDFTDMPFESERFKLVVFDPPHITTLGQNSWMAKKYGKLEKNWQPIIKAGFNECMRVLEPYGVLIFKWNEHDVKLSDVLKVIEAKPLFGHTSGRQSKTIWMTFMKLNQINAA